MSKIAIDARTSGETTGRYVDKLIEYFHKLKPEFEIVVLTKPHRVEFIKQIAPNFEVVEAPFKEFSFQEQGPFKKLLIKVNADLVHFGMVQQPVFYRGKVVTTMHDLTTVRFKNPSKNPIVFMVKQTVYKWVNKKAARKSSKIITATQFVKEDVQKFSGVKPDKIVVTYEAADKILEPAEPMLRLQNLPFIFYTGRPMPHKNLQRLIEAFVKLRQTHPNLVLALAGKTDVNYKAIQAMVENKKIQNVMFTDFVTEGELRWMYEHAKAYIFPSLSEGFGLPGLEAMIHGCPVVSSNATCLPEVYKDGAEYFDPKNVDDIAEKIAKVINDPKLAGQLVIKGSLVANSYSWQRMAEQTLTVYREVLGQK